MKTVLQKDPGNTKELIYLSVLNFLSGIDSKPEEMRLQCNYFQHSQRTSHRQGTFVGERAKFSVVEQHCADLLEEYICQFLLGSQHYTQYLGAGTVEGVRAKSVRV